MARMRMVGHRTEAIYRRYAIVDEAMPREGSEKLARAATLAREANWPAVQASVQVEGVALNHPLATS